MSTESAIESQKIEVRAKVLDLKDHKITAIPKEAVVFVRFQSLSFFIYIIYAHISIVYTYIYIYCVCVLTAFGCDLLEGSRRFCACHSLWLSSSEFFQSIVFLCVRASIWKRSGSDPSQGVGLAKERTGGCHDMHDEDLQDVNDST